MFFEFFAFILQFIQIIQLIVFLVTWTMLLFGVYNVVDSLLRQWYPQYPRLHFAGAFTITSSILFELLHRWNEVREDCSWFALLFSVHCQSSSMWSLNPVKVVAHLIGDVIVLCSRVFGRSCAVFVSSFFEELPWLLSIPSLLFVAFFLFVVLLSLMGYSLSIAGIIRLQPRPLFTIREPTATPIEHSGRAELCQASSNYVVKKTDELYQKEINLW